jgi:trimeric autotransporter adhesin
MKKHLLFISAFLMAFQLSFGQLSGTKSIPGDYATIQAAIAALNAQGVGAGGVTFNVAAGYTETIAAPLSITATGTSADQIIFIKFGGGANPLITAYTGTNTPASAVQDGIWNLIGSDYVTINGIDLYDPNSTNPATMEYGYAMFKAAVDNGCQNNTIINCTVTLSRENNASGSGPAVDGSRAINVVNATADAQTTAMTPTTAAGTNTSNKFYSNTLQNCNIGIALIGYAAATPFTLADFGNDIGGTSTATGNTIINYGGGTGATNPAAGVRTLAQYNLNVSYNTVNNNTGTGVNHVSTLRGIYINTATSANANINNNILSVSSGATTSQVSVIENTSGTTAAGNTININNNVIQNCTWTTATSGTFYGIYNTGSPAYININSNSFTNVTRTGTGTNYFTYTSGGTLGQSFNGNTFNNLTVNTTGSVYLIYCGASMVAGGIQTVSNNSIIGTFNKTGAGGTLYFAYTNSGSPAGSTANWQNNNFSNITVTGATTIMGLQNTDGGAPTKTFSGNTISNITGGSSAITGINFNYGTADIYNNVISGITSSAAITAITAGGASATLQNVYSNNVNNLSSTGASLVQGIASLASGTSAVSKVYQNNIYNLTADNASGSVYGLSITAGTTVYAYNNMISNLRTPSANAANPLIGINVSGGTNVSLYYNSVYLNATSTGALFGSSGVYASTTPTFDLRNNIIVNVSTPVGATGFTSAYRRSSTTLTTYASTANNNDFFAGTPGANNLIFFDGTNSDQTIGAFKTRVSPRDAASFTENPPFVNVAAPPYNLHLQTTVATQCESGGVPISSPIAVTTDFDGNSRNATMPDVGADEFAGIPLDLTPPNIVFTPLTNTAGYGNRTLITTITDATGVPTSGTGLPMLYWKVNSGAFTGVQAIYLGSNQYSFTFGAGVTLGDVVSYYFVSQDIVTPTPNIGATPGAGASGFTTNPPACSTPPTTPYTYTVVGAISGVVTVGTGGTYPSLTGSGGLFAAINSKVMVGNITAQIVSNLTEDGSNALNQIAQEPAGSNFTLSIVPNSSTGWVISGTYAGGLIRLNGADYVIFDGRYGGSGNYLTFTNTVTSGTIATIQVISLGNGTGATGVTIRNCNVSTGFITSGSYGIAVGGTTVATTGADNDNLTIMNNNISKAYVGIWAQGTAATNPGANDNLQIIGNSLGAATSTDYLGHDGMILANATGSTISQNTVYNIITSNTTPVGITLSTGFVNSTVSRNNLNNITYTGTGGYGGRGMYINTATSPSNLTFDNNLVYVIGGDGWSTFAGSSMVGMYFDGSMSGLNIYYNSVYMSGTFSRSSNTITTAILFNTTTITNIDLRNNIFQNAMDNSYGTTDFNYAIYTSTAASAFTQINYNDYYANGPQGMLGYLGSNIATLTAWRTATGQDANSQNIDPAFVSTTDLHPTNAAFNNLGTYMAAFPADYSNVSRTNPPDMGAFEFGTNPTLSTSAASGVTCDAATLNGSLNANGLVVNTYFDYGLTTSYGSTATGNPPTVTGSTTTAVSANLTGLNSSATYHFRIRGVTNTGVTSYGDDLTFVTGASGAPNAATLAANGIGLNYATLNGNVTANCYTTTVTFEYGLTSGYGTTVTAIESPLNGGIATNVSVNLTGLGISTLYHFRVVASNSQGTVYGSDMTFTTGASAPTVVTNAATGIDYFTAQVNGTVTANNQTTTVTFEWGLTTSYGNTINAIPLTIDGAVATPEYAILTGLTHNTTYHYRCVGQNSTGTTYGADQTFTTLCHLPEAAGTITGPDSLCQATSGNVYSIAAVQFATGYTWSLPPGGTITAGANTNSITVDYSGSATSGNVTVYATNVCGNGTTATLPVAVYPLPVPTISGANPACVGSNYQYTTENGMSGYTWTVSAGGTITAGAGTRQITIHWNNTGAQSVSVTYTSQYGCAAAAPTVLNVNVSSLPTPTIAGSNTMCEDEGYHVYTTQQGYTNYVWTVTSGGSIVSGQGTYQIEVDWFNAGNQTVTVNYTNASGCYASSPASFAVTVLPKPGAAGAISGPNSVCEGEQGGYSVSPIANADVYVWTVPAGATIVDGIGTNSIKVVFGPGSSGNISVFGSNVCGDGAPSAAYHVTVNPLPATPVVTADANYLLTSSAPEGNQWYFNGTMIDGATGQTYQAEEEGFYWTVVTLNGCTSAESNHVEIIFTGLDELPGTSVRTYPIPNSGQFTVSIINQAEQSYDIYVMNNLGVRIYEKTRWVVSRKGELNIDLGVVSKGIYTLMIQSKENRMVRKIIVSK